MFVRTPFKIAAVATTLRNTECSTVWRYVRSIAKRPPMDSIKTLKGQVKTDHEHKLDDDFVSMQDTRDLKRMVRQVFVNTDETQTGAEYDFEGDYDAPFEHAEKYYDINIQEEKVYKSMVKKKIIGKKYFKEPPETNLLTYAAKMQIRHLHKMDPIEWTLEKLSESFPISLKGVKRLLKSNFETNDEERIKQHDADVRMKWKLLESGNAASVSPVTWKLFIAGKMTKDHHAGNFSLPCPVSQQKLPEVKKKKIGEHAAMIKYYLDLKKNADTKEVTLKVKNTNTNLDLTDDDENVKLSELEQRDIQKSVLPEFKPMYPRREEMEDMKSASYLAAEKPDPCDIEIPQAQFEENLLQEFEEKHSKTSVDTAYEKWVQDQIVEKSEPSEKRPQPFDSRDFFEAIKKYNGEAIELCRDKNNAYLYEKQLGYQHFSGEEFIPRRIKIPKEKYIQGALYRVGKSYYADDGEFLYKLCV